MIIGIGQVVEIFLCFPTICWHHARNLVEAVPGPLAGISRGMISGRAGALCALSSLVSHSKMDDCWEGPEM